MLTNKRVVLTVLFLAVFLSLTMLLVSPTQLSLIDPSAPITTIGTLEVTKGDIITIFTLLSGTGGLISVIYTISSLSSISKR